MDADKKTDEELRRLLAECPAPGKLWSHYKGGVYRVIGRAILEATRGPVVVYQSLDSGVTFARPLAEWREKFTQPEERP